MPTFIKRHRNSLDDNSPGASEIDENVTLHQLEKYKSDEQSEGNDNIHKTEEEDQSISSKNENKSIQASEENKSGPANSNSVDNVILQALLERRTFQQSWEEKIEALKDFKAKYGHTKVPKNDEYKQLGRFVNNLRQSYRKHMNEKSSSLTDDRIRDLEELGFVWVCDKPISVGRERNLQAQWKQRIQELKEYKEIHGHCNVGVKGEDRVLGKFVMNQRYYYKTLFDGEKNSLTPERIKDLKDVGFVWTLKGSRDGEDGKFLNNEEKWERKIEELKQFKEKFGHVNVSKTADYMGLGQFVGNQRYFYRRRMKGEQTSLTDERMEILNDLGFEWKAHTRNSGVCKVDIFSKTKSDNLVVEKEKEINLPDGSTIDCATKESSQKRLIELEDGSQVLQTTSKTHTTKIEKSVIPPGFAEDEDVEMSADATHPALPGGLNVSHSKNTVFYPDGSSADTAKDETCTRKVTVLPDNSQLLETTTTTIVTKFERSRLV